MSPKKRTGVSIRRRKLRSGDIHWQVRWRERLNGEWQQFSEQFSDIMMAEKFAVEVAARMGVVRAGRKTKLAEDLVKPLGDLERLIPQFVAERKASGKEESSHPHLLQYRLERLKAQFDWKTTADITRDSIEVMLSGFRLKGQYSSASHFLSAVKNFLGWASGIYQINEEVFRAEADPPDPADRVLWTDEQVCRILDFLKNPTNHQPKNFGGKRKSQKWTEIELVCFARFHPIFRLGVLWAPRPVEASRLLVRHWDGKRRLLTLPPKITKNGTGRSFFVDPGTAGCLDLCANGKDGTDYFIYEYRWK
jgi:hypothetical protein